VLEKYKALERGGDSLTRVLQCHSHYTHVYFRF